MGLKYLAEVLNPNKNLAMRLLGCTPLVHCVGDGGETELKPK